MTKSTNPAATGENKTERKSVNVAVSPKTKKAILAEIDRLNKHKSFGRRLRPDDLLSFALTLIEPKHQEALQESTMTHKDRFRRQHEEYVKKHGPISEDQFFGMVLNGEVPKETLTHPRIPSNGGAPTFGLETNG